MNEAVRLQSPPRPTHKLARLVAWCALCFAMLFVSCGAQRGGKLQGSLLDFYDVEYSTVRARLYSSELAIEYVREDGEVPVRVTVLRDVDLVAGESFDLPERGHITGRVGDTDIPEIANGSVLLEEFEIVDGSQVVGNFSASFSLGTDTASLSGDFDVPLEIVDRVRGYPHDFGTDMADMGDDSGDMTGSLD